MKRYFLTHIAPKDKILEYKLSSAACNFSYNLMSGRAFDYVQGKKEFPENGDVEYIYSSWRWGNRMLRKFAAIRENITVFRKIERGPGVTFRRYSFLDFRWYTSECNWVK